jgi:hypothetical protein
VAVTGTFPAKDHTPSGITVATALHNEEETNCAVVSSNPEGSGPVASSARALKQHPEPSKKPVKRPDVAVDKLPEQSGQFSLMRTLTSRTALQVEFIVGIFGLAFLSRTSGILGEFLRSFARLLYP